ncbi:hypothetical protein MLD38_008572 [Melastoma candidum]|uniref:Uncharacterized protein n=1 Tax=Melastoma candidum TaxID=119954 RepID=A0ACB9RUD8_9MYRT|nr:hypothetical protein MLD38_008572 [Melastoma candidum]
MGFEFDLFEWVGVASVALALVVTLVLYVCVLRLCPRRDPVSGGGGCLDRKRFKEFRLARITPMTHNTSRFRFDLPTPASYLGLPVGQHIVCRGCDGDGKEVIRPYTPITLDSDKGYFELVMYPEGRMSHHFRQMRIGDYLPVQGPKGRFKYKPGQEELDVIADNFPDRFKLYYVLTKILRCGPPGMNKAMAAHLHALGYTSDMLFEF